jgi:hypothetical protein
MMKILYGDQTEKKTDEQSITKLQKLSAGLQAVRDRREKRKALQAPEISIEDMLAQRTERMKALARAVRDEE